MDVTDSLSNGNPIKIAHQLQQKISSELDLPCSIGIAPNKFLAKMASDMKKPMGITVLRKREIQKILWPLPIEDMYGVGDKTAIKLRNIGVKTIGDLAKKDVYGLKQILGINGERLQNRANGIDPRPVDPDAVHEFKSIGSSQTLPHDTTDEREIQQLLQSLTDNVVRRLQRKQAVGKSVQLMIRFHDRKTITRSRKLTAYIETKEEILQVANELLHEHWNGEPVRLIGVTVQDINEKRYIGKQLDLFTYEKEKYREKLDSVIEDLSRKYGQNPFKQWKGEDFDSDQPRTSFQKDFLDDFKR
jgi:DNA polymerase-4